MNIWWKYQKHENPSFCETKEGSAERTKRKSVYIFSRVNGGAIEDCDS